MSPAPTSTPAHHDDPPSSTSPGDEVETEPAQELKEMSCSGSASEEVILPRPQKGTTSGEQAWSGGADSSSVSGCSTASPEVEEGVSSVPQTSPAFSDAEPELLVPLADGDPENDAFCAPSRGSGGSAHQSNVNTSRTPAHPMRGTIPIGSQLHRSPMSMSFFALMGCAGARDREDDPNEFVTQHATTTTSGVPNATGAAAPIPTIAGGVQHNPSTSASHAVGGGDRMVRVSPRRRVGGADAGAGGDHAPRSNSRGGRGMGTFLEGGNVGPTVSSNSGLAEGVDRSSSDLLQSNPSERERAGGASGLRRAASGEGGSTSFGVGMRAWNGQWTGPVQVIESSDSDD